MANIVSIKKRRNPPTEREAWLRRIAVQVVAQLPESEAEAVKVLKIATEIVLFLGEHPS